MAKAAEVAAELRKLADHLDRFPEVEVTTPDLYFWHGSDTKEKDRFLAAARILPRPVVKNYPSGNEAYSRISVTHKMPALNIQASIYRESVCTVITPAQPAVYDCALTLLDHEDAALEADNG